VGAGAVAFQPISFWRADSAHEQAEDYQLLGLRQYGELHHVLRLWGEVPLGRCNHPRSLRQEYARQAKDGEMIE
jgi:hypothetical protein